MKSQHDKGLPFLVTIAYFLSFLIIRLMVILAGSAESEFAQAAKMGMTPETDFYIGRNIILFGYHIHHFYFGILLIALAGWWAIVGSRFFSHRHLALIYGAGLGLFMDEIGLLLTWGDYYSSLTYILSLFLVGVFLNVVFFADFWKSTRTEFGEGRAKNLVWKWILTPNTFLKVADKVSKVTGKTEKSSLLFTGVVYFAVGILILLYPRFIYYWVAGVFILQGVASLVRAWRR